MASLRKLIADFELNVALGRYEEAQAFLDRKHDNCEEEEEFEKEEEEGSGDEIDEEEASEDEDDRGEFNNPKKNIPDDSKVEPSQECVALKDKDVHHDVKPNHDDATEREDDLKLD